MNIADILNRLEIEPVNSRDGRAIALCQVGHKATLRLTLAMFVTVHSWVEL